MGNTAKPKRKRAVRTFPALPFSEPYQFAVDIDRIGSGQKVRRLTVFDELGRTPTSSASQNSITAASKYGLVKGSHSSDFLELTPLGHKAISERSSPREKEKAKIESAILSVVPFKGLFEAFQDNKLPARTVLIDKAIELGVDERLAEEAVDTFIVNAREVGILKTLAGAERFISIDMRLDELPSAGITESPASSSAPLQHTIVTSAHASFESSCFYVTPIGEPGSPQRRHADMFANSIVEPAIEFSKLKLVRADEIESPGLITKQIIEYLVNARLVIADLSFHNPNVFYELAVRHMLRKPTVQIMRKVDRIPFDVAQSRTVIIDEEDKYDLIAKMPTFISDLSAQVRQALESGASDNPISVFVPGLQSHVTTEPI